MPRPPRHAWFAALASVALHAWLLSLPLRTPGSAPEPAPRTPGARPADDLVVVRLPGDVGTAPAPLDVEDAPPRAPGEDAASAEPPPAPTVADERETTSLPPSRTDDPAGVAAEGERAPAPVRPVQLRESRWTRLLEAPVLPPSPAPVDLGAAGERMRGWSPSAVGADSAWFAGWTAEAGEERWGAAPGALRLGQLTLPFCSGPATAADCGFGLEPAAREAWLQALELRQGLAEQVRRAVVRERAEAIRERRDAERAEEAADSTSTGSGTGRGRGGGPAAR